MPPGRARIHSGKPEAAGEEAVACRLYVRAGSPRVIPTRWLTRSVMHLDAMIKDDPRSRVAVETLITTGQVHVAVRSPRPTTSRGSTGRRSGDRLRPRAMTGHRAACPSPSGRSHPTSPRASPMVTSTAKVKRRTSSTGRARQDEADVRLCLPRDARADAAAHHARAPAGPAAHRRPVAQRPAATAPAPGRQDTSHDRICRGRTAAAGHRGRVRAARTRHRPRSFSPRTCASTWSSL